MTIELSDAEFKTLQSCIDTALDEGQGGRFLNEDEWDALLDKFQLQAKWYLYSKKRQKEHKEKEIK